jgi:Clp amino terminal domain, pathogenicity island component
MRPLELADLVLIAAKTLGLDTGATLDLLDTDAAEAALAEAHPGHGDPELANTGPANTGPANTGPANTELANTGSARLAAELLHALIRHRPFRHGNDQVAIMAMVQCLAINGWRAELGPPKAVRTVITELAAGRLPATDLAAWLSPRLFPYPEPVAKEAPMHGWRPGRGRPRQANGMLDRMTARAREVIIAAQDEARALRHNYIGTEHILLGLVKEGDGVAGRALNALGISLEAVRQQVLEIIGEGRQAPAGHIPFTPRSKKVLDLALREAMHLDHLYIGTEHILLGLVREGDGVAFQVLTRLGADHARVREQVLGLLADHAQSRNETVPPGIRDYDVQIAQARQEKDAAIDAQDFDRAAALRASEKQLLAERDRMIAAWSAGADVVALGQEVDRLRHEVSRLQDMLRRHGIEPGEVDQQSA